MGKVIITAALTGAIHTPSMSQYLPFKPKDLIEDAVRCHNAGAAVVHVHARNPEDGSPSSSGEIFREVLSGIKARSKVVITPTTGGSPTMTPHERLAVVSALRPEMATFNAGSLNFALYPVLQKYQEFQFPWEKAYLEATEAFIFSNTFQSLHIYSKTMKETNTRPEIEIYDVGQVNNVAQLVSEGYLQKPVYLQFVMGILGGIPATSENLLYLIRESRRLLGDQFLWSVCAAGRFQFNMGVVNVIEGGFWRVGLEDNLYLEKGVLARSSAEQVEKAIRIIRELGYEPATEDEAREILQLKGIDNVNY
ncbi:MAG: 3-keto-5-aminohexanoate cleavage protein [Desulfobacteraceae bacterium]|nr:MAG: 3-keto-5-aminohexanoate cleavage protein [Desulfobacteraceae bacterium]